MWGCNDSSLGFAHRKTLLWLVILRYCLFMGCLPQSDLEIMVDGCKFLEIWKKQRDYSGTDLGLGTARDRELPDCIQQELSVWSLMPKSHQPHWGKQFQSLTDTNALISESLVTWDYCYLREDVQGKWAVLCFCDLPNLMLCHGSDQLPNQILYVLGLHHVQRATPVAENNQRAEALD